MSIVVSEFIFSRIAGNKAFCEGVRGILIFKSLAVALVPSKNSDLFF